MKKSNILFTIFLTITLSFSSCSKEDSSLPVREEMAYLSFHMFLNDLEQGQQNRQVNYDIPMCTQGIPAFLDIILTNADLPMADPAASPMRLSLNSIAPTIFQDGVSGYLTGESASIQLVPGTYTLEYCTVLDANGNVLWIAPINDNEPGGFDDMVEHSLPMQITLNPGVYKAQDVDVICFDDRIINQYGYLFYELQGVQVIEFCIFGNYCDETGRHAEFINYAVNVWKFSGDAWAPKGELLHEDLENEVVVTDYENEDQSEVNSYPLCLTLPDGPGLDEYYIEITRTYSGSDDGIIRSGLISDEDVRNLFRENETMDYYHFREGNCYLEDDPLLMSDHRDILGFTWEFTFNFGDATIVADVVFHPDGTASFQLNGDPNPTTSGIWTYFNEYLYYDFEENEEIPKLKTSGKYDNGSISGRFLRDGVEEEWNATRKN